MHHLDGSISRFKAQQGIDESGLDSWVPILKEGFKKIEGLMVKPVSSQDSKLSPSTMRSISSTSLERPLEDLNIAIKKIFQNCSKTDYLVKVGSYFPLFWNAKAKLVFIIPMLPFPTIHAKGGWKTGTLSMMLESEKKEAALVWLSKDKEEFRLNGKLKEELLQNRDFGKFKEVELTDLHGDTGYWPKVYFSFRTREMKAYSYLDTRYLFSEYYFCNLNEARHRFAFPLEAMVAVINQVAEALKFIHNLNLIHGDVKPENILVGGKGVTLCDYDYLFDQTKKRPGFIIYGQPGAASPELVEDYTKVKEFRPSDSYAFGISLFETITLMNDEEYWVNDITSYYYKQYEKHTCVGKTAAEDQASALKKQRALEIPSDKSMDALKVLPAILSDEVIALIRTALIHPVMKKRATADFIVEITSRYKGLFPTNIYNSLIKKIKP